MSVAGFDIGNATSCVALARKRGIDVLMNKESKRETPTCVSFTEKRRFMGGDASQSMATNMKNTISDLKRLVGKRFSRPDVQADIKDLPFEVVEGPDGKCHVKVRYLGEEQLVSCERLFAMMLVEMKAVAEADQGSAVTDCVIAVPCYFSDEERAAVQDAAKIAGLHCLRVMNENTATALSYGIYKTDLPEDAPAHVVFVDFGHNSIQVSVVAFQKGQLRVLSHAWDSGCGGRDFDAVLFDHLCAEFKEKYKIDVRSNRRAALRLRIAVEKLKKVLSSNAVAPIGIECLMDDKDVQSTVSRETFEGLAQPLMQRAVSTVARAIEESGLKTDQIASIEVVGGSSRMPAFLTGVKQLYGRDAGRTLNAKECVSRGCALHCAMLSPIFRVKDFKVEEAAPFPVNMSWVSPDDGKQVTVEVFKKNAAVSTQGSYKEVTLYRKDNFDVHLHFADGALLPEGVPRDIGTYRCGPLRVPEGQDKAKVKVKVQMGMDCTATVNTVFSEEVQVVEEPAAEGGEKAEGEEAAAPKRTETKVKHNIIFEGPKRPGMDEATMQSALEAEFSMAQTDRVQEATAEAKNALEAHILAKRSQLYDQLADFVDEATRSQLVSDLERAEDWLYDEGEDCSKGVYVEKLAELRKLTDPIDKRRAEDMERPGLCEELIKFCKGFQDSAASSAPELAHITAEERGQVQQCCAEALQWLEGKQAEQANLPKHQDPVLTCAAIKDKAAAVGNTCKPILSKPAPKPEPPKEDVKEGDEGAKPAEGGAEAMEEDAAEPANGEAMDVDNK
ncbi:unnamed protein product [Pedinophyceae sp. YPF-701]|nr:unnamed protein product [Pedinophyceae sp. YPF-701]